MASVTIRKHNGPQRVRTLWGWAPLTGRSGRSTSGPSVPGFPAGFRRGDRDKPFEAQGAEAYRAGVPSRNNPYGHRDERRKLWSRGWQRARMQAQRRAR